MPLASLCGCGQVCPILIRVFCGFGRHHLPADYMRGKTPGNELQLYTWYTQSSFLQFVANGSGRNFVVKDVNYCQHDHTDILV